MAPGRHRALRHPPRSKPGATLPAVQPTSDATRPTWDAVEALIARLAETHAVFPTASSPSNWISTYEPGRRLVLESAGRWRWVRLEDVESCWRTLERLGRIRRADVLEPGRASAFVMALFAQVGGVRRIAGDEPYLVLSQADAPPSD